MKLRKKEVSGSVNFLSWNKVAQNILRDLVSAQWEEEDWRLNSTIWLVIQSCPRNETPIKTVDIDAPVSFPSW